MDGKVRSYQAGRLANAQAPVQTIHAKRFSFQRSPGLPDQAGAEARVCLRANKMPDRVDKKVFEQRETGGSCEGFEKEKVVCTLHDDNYRGLESMHRPSRSALCDVKHPEERGDNCRPIPLGGV